MERPTGVLLDVDGTLVDSNDAHAHAWVKALAEASVRAEFAAVRRLIGKGGDKLLPEVSGIDAESPKGKSISDRRGEIFQAEYLPDLKPFPGVRELLARMTQAGLELAVASSSKKDELKGLLKVCGADAFIKASTSSDDAENSKPDPDIVHAALDRLGHPPGKVILLGDTPYDVEASRKAGVRVVALRCGGWGDADLKGAVRIYDDPADLLARFDESPFGGEQVKTEGKVVLVTGATSGIGKATAELLAANGCRVFGTSRDPAGKTGSGFELLQLDVTSDESVNACVSAVAERTGGRIDVLHNNAGTGIIGAAEEVTPDEALRLFQVNFFGVMRMTNAVLPHMRARNAGTVINMSSSGGVAALPFAALYCATKFALEGYTEALRHELRPFNIAAVVVAPGPVSTPAGDTAMRAERHIPEYADRRRKADSLAIRGIRGGMDPKRVAGVILKVVTAGWPSPRYPVGLQSRATDLAHGLLPPGAFEAAVRWGVGLG